MDERVAELEDRVRRLEMNVRLLAATTRSEFRDHMAIEHPEQDTSQGIAAAVIV